MLLTETLLRRHSVDLKYAQLKAAHRSSPSGGYPYQTVLVKGRLLYYLPVGGSITPLPAVAIINAAGISTIGADGHYNLEGESRIQRILAPLLMAAMVWVVFRTALLVALPPSVGILIALGTAFGTQVWSTTSRALWSLSWLVLLQSVVIWILLRCEKTGSKLRPGAHGHAAVVDVLSCGQPPPLQS